MKRTDSDIIGCISGSDFGNEQDAPWIRCLMEALRHYTIHRILFVFDKIMMANLTKKYGLSNEEEAIRNLLNRFQKRLGVSRKPKAVKDSVSFLDSPIVFIDQTTPLDISGHVFVKKTDCGISETKWLESFRELASFSSSNVIYLNLQSGSIESRLALQFLAKEVSDKKKIRFFAVDNHHSGESDPRSKENIPNFLPQNWPSSWKDENPSQDLSGSRTSCLDSYPFSRLVFQSAFCDLLRKRKIKEAVTLYQDNFSSVLTLNPSVLNNLKDYVGMAGPYFAQRKEDMTVVKEKDLKRIMRQVLLMTSYTVLVRDYSLLQSCLIEISQGAFLLVDKIPDKNRADVLKNLAHKARSLFSSLKHHTKDDEFFRIVETDMDNLKEFLSKLPPLLNIQFSHGLSSDLPEFYLPLVEQELMKPSTQLIRKNIAATPKASERLCVIGMVGSTDPCSFRLSGTGKMIRYDGSLLNFWNLTKNPAAHYPFPQSAKAPFYCILTKEMAERLAEHGIVRKDMAALYQKNEILLLPFSAEHVERGLIQSFKKPEALLPLISEDMSIKYTERFLTHLLSLIGSSYDRILFLTSSGLPNFKMAMLFRAYSNPNRYAIIQTVTPNPNGLMKPQNLAKTTKESLVKESRIPLARVDEVSRFRSALPDYFLEGRLAEATSLFSSLFPEEAKKVHKLYDDMMAAEQSLPKDKEAALLDISKMACEKMLERETETAKDYTRVFETVLGRWNLETELKKGQESKLAYVMPYLHFSKKMILVDNISIPLIEKAKPELTSKMIGFLNWASNDNGDKWQNGYYCLFTNDSSGKPFTSACYILPAIPFFWLTHQEIPDINKKLSCVLRNWRSFSGSKHNKPINQSTVPDSLSLTDVLAEFSGYPDALRSIISLQQSLYDEMKSRLA